MCEVRGGRRLVINNFGACGNGGFIRAERRRCSYHFLPMNACGCGEFLSPSHRLFSSYIEAKASCSFSPHLPLQYSLLSSLHPLSLSIFLSIPRWLYSPSGSAAAVNSNTPLFKFKGSFIGRTEICIAKNPPSDRLHWLYGLHFLISVSIWFPLTGTKNTKQMMCVQLQNVIQDYVAKSQFELPCKSIHVSLPSSHSRSTMDVISISCD